jgi:16S rRNA (cytosine1402-N4)-methyltransferase
LKHNGKIHEPVLLEETIDYLNLGDGRGKCVIDATLDGGGHATALRERLPDVKIFGIELDPVMVEELELDPSITVINDSYANIKNIVNQYNLKPNGVYFDLGVSSWHYESSSRGFTFQKDQPLDMRFNPDKQATSALDIVNKYTQAELEEILIKYGEEQFAKEISESINKKRKSKPIITTLELVEAVGRAVPEWYKHKKINFATKTFQAIRVEVNDEINTIRAGVEGAMEVLVPGGRLIVISFQGLEDKTVKEIFKQKAKEGVIKFVTKDTIKPRWNEVVKNPRARSAKMKIVEKL